jgi:uncharacterized protein YjbI with pentapeptide repeats
MLSITELIQKNLDYINKDLAKTPVRIALSELSTKPIKHYLSAYFGEISEPEENLFIEFSKAEFDRAYNTNFTLSQVKNRNKYIFDIGTNFFTFRPFISLSLVKKDGSAYTCEKCFRLYFLISYFRNSEDIWTLANYKSSNFCMAIPEREDFSEFTNNGEEDSEVDLYDTRLRDAIDAPVKEPDYLGYLVNMKKLESLLYDLLSKNLIITNKSEAIIDAIDLTAKFNKLLNF